MKEILLPFYSEDDILNWWKLDAPRGDAVSNKGGYWCFDDERIDRIREGYLEINSKSPTRENSVFSLINKIPINVKDSEIWISYKYQQEVDSGDMYFKVWCWNGDLWVLYDSFYFEESESEDWEPVNFKVENFNNSDFFVKFEIKIGKEKAYKKEFKLKDVKIELFNTLNNEIKDYFIKNKIPLRNENIYDLSKKTNVEVDLFLEDFKSKIPNFNYSNFPKGVILKNDKIIHLFNEKDK